MKVFDLIKLALLNIVTNLKMAISILIGFVIIMEVIMISLGYGYSMNNYIENIINSNSSSAYCSVYIENHNKIDIDKISNDSKIEGIQIIEKYDIYQYCEDNNKTINTSPLAENAISFDAAIMKIDDTTYWGKNDNSYDFASYSKRFEDMSDKNVKLEIGVMEGENNLQISKNERQEFRKKYNKKNPILVGGEFTKENQIIITEYILEKFGYNYSAKECIGKKISLYVATEDGEFCIVDNYEVCGVIDSNFYRINSKKYEPQILLSNANPAYNIPLYEKIFGNGFREITQFYYNYMELNILSIDFETMEYAEVETQQLLYNEVVLVICTIIIISVIVFVYILIYFYFRKRTRYVCIQKAMGMSGRKLYTLIFTELSIIATIAALVSIPTYYGLLQVLNNVISMIVTDSFILTQTDFAIAVCSALIITLFLNAIISTLEYHKTRNYTIVNRDKFI